eukprot:Opistho-2@48383
MGLGGGVNAAAFSSVAYFCAGAAVGCGVTIIASRSLRPSSRKPLVDYPSSEVSDNVRRLADAVDAMRLVMEHTLEGGARKRGRSRDRASSLRSEDSDTDDIFTDALDNASETSGVSYASAWNGIDAHANGHESDTSPLSCSPPTASSMANGMGNGMGNGHSETSLGLLFRQVEALRDDGRMRETLEILRRCRAQHPKSVEVLWRLARAHYDVCETLPKGCEEKRQIVNEGVEIASLALQIDDRNPRSHRWYAIILSSKGDWDSTKEKIKNGFVFREHIEKAIELDPHDPTAHHLLGRWCYEVALLSWIERKAATAIFGAPPTATMDDALHSFLEAERLRPGVWKMNTLMVARSYLQKKDRGNAAEWLNRTLSLPTTTAEDRQAHEEATQLLKKL